MADFLAALDPIYRVADGDAPIVVNLSVWESYLALHAITYRSITYRSAHGASVRRRSRWFLPTPRAFTVRRRFEPDGRPTPPFVTHPSGCSGVPDRAPLTPGAVCDVPLMTM